MKIKHKTGARGVTLTKGVLVGILSSVLLSLVCAAFAAMLMVKGNAAESMGKSFAFGITLLSVLLGTFVSCRSVGNKSAKISALVGGGYCFLLIAGNVLLFDGIFRNVALSILMILAGCGLGCVLAMKRGTRRKNKRMRFR